MRPQVQSNTIWHSSISRQLSVPFHIVTAINWWVYFYLSSNHFKRLLLSTFLNMKLYFLFAIWFKYNFLSKYFLTAFCSNISSFVCIQWFSKPHIMKEVSLGLTYYWVRYYTLHNDWMLLIIRWLVVSSEWNMHLQIC